MYWYPFNPRRSTVDDEVEDIEVLPDPDAESDWGKAVKAPPRRPSDDLPERRTFLRLTTIDIPDYENPTIATLEKHAERFGSGSVVVTAIELGFQLEAVIRLQDACDRIDQEHELRDHPHRRVEKTQPSEDRVRKLMGLPTVKEEAEAAAAYEAALAA